MNNSCTNKVSSRQACPVDCCSPVISCSSLFSTLKWHVTAGWCQTRWDEVAVLKSHSVCDISKWTFCESYTHSQMCVYIYNLFIYLFVYIYSNNSNSNICIYPPHRHFFFIKCHNFLTERFSSVLVINHKCMVFYVIAKVLLIERNQWNCFSVNILIKFGFWFIAVWNDFFFFLLKTTGCL